jgi:hypothetical protein
MSPMCLGSGRGNPGHPGTESRKLLHRRNSGDRTQPRFKDPNAEGLDNIASPAFAPSAKKQNCALRKEPVRPKPREWGTLFFLRYAKGGPPSLIAACIRSSRDCAQLEHLQNMR